MKKKKKRYIRFKLIVLCFLFGILWVFYSFRVNAQEVVVAMSRSRIRAIAMTSVNLAIYETLNGVSYSDLMTVERNEEGDIVLLAANAAKINRVARDTAFYSQKNLEQFGMQGIEIPAGAFTGSQIFAGFGPPVTVKIIPVGSVDCEFFSEYESVGINQTLHRIFLEAEAEVDIILPGASVTVNVPTQVFVCETVLVGKVPETFLSANKLGNGYDF
jgi:sporulation protein YunB